MLNDVSGFAPTDVDFSGPSVQLEGPLTKNMTFGSKRALINAVNKFHIEKNKQIEVTDSSQSKYRAKCKDPNCEWSLYATPTKSDSAWVIRTCRFLHTCNSIVARIDHAQLTSLMIADIIRDELNDNLGMSIKTVGAMVRKVFPGVKPKYNKLWRGRETAMAMLFGSWSGSYALLPRLLNAIRTSNPGSKTVLQSVPTANPNVRQFARAAWAFAPCIQAFQFLRPVLSIDASFLHGRYSGRLLVAVGYDAENQLLPLAFGLVETESGANWGWFMRWLRCEVVGNRPICVISDRHLGIKHVFHSPLFGWNEEENQAVHRLCAQHIAENLLKECRNKAAQEKFNQTCRKHSVREFNEGMKEIRRLSIEASEYLKHVGKLDETNKNANPTPHKWSQCHDGGYRWGIMTSNGAESLNRVFKVCRGLPVCAIVETSFYKCVNWFAKRRVESEALASKGQLFSDLVTAKLEKAVLATQNLEVTEYDVVRNRYEVVAKNERETPTGRQDRSYKVELVEGQRPRCKCRQPDNTAIACSHILKVCAVRNYNPNMYSHRYYSTESLVNTWQGQFEIFGKEEDWPEYHGETIIPDKKLVVRGRRKHTRHPMMMDRMAGRTGPLPCEVCGSINHLTDRCTQRNTQTEQSGRAHSARYSVSGVSRPST